MANMDSFNAPVGRLVFSRLSDPLLCHGVSLRRFHAVGLVWLLSREIDLLPAVSTWALRKRDPAITGRRLRLADGDMRPRLAFTLPVVRQMALMCSGPAALALFEVVSEEIAAGRHLFPGGVHGK